MTTAAVMLVLALIVTWCAFTAGRIAERTDQRHQRELGDHLHPAGGRASVIDQPPGEYVRRRARPPFDWNAEGDSVADDE